MRKSLEVGCILHDAEAATERHERVPVEIPQGPAGGDDPRLVNIGRGRVLAAIRTAGYNLPRAEGAPERTDPYYPRNKAVQRTNLRS